MAWKPAVALSVLVAGAAVNAEEASLVDSNINNGRSLQGYSKWSRSISRPTGRHHSLRQHVRKSFTSRRPHNPLWKKYDHESETSGSSYGKEQSGYSTEDNYPKSRGSHTHRAKSDGEQSGGSWYPSDHLNDSDVVGDSEPEEPKDKPATGYGRQYKSGHRLTKHLLHKHFSGKSYNPLSNWGPGYDVSSVRGGGSHTGKSKSVKSYSSHSDSGSGHSHVKPFHSNKKLFLKHLFSKKGHKAVDVVIETPGKPASPQKNHGSPKGHHVSVFAGGYSHSSHNKDSLHKKIIHKKSVFKGTHKPWPVVTKTHHGTGYSNTAETNEKDAGAGDYIEVVDNPDTGYGGGGASGALNIKVPEVIDHHHGEIVEVYIDPEADGAIAEAMPKPEPEYTATYNTGY